MAITVTGQTYHTDYLVICLRECLILKILGIKKKKLLKGSFEYGIWSTALIRNDTTYIMG